MMHILLQNSVTGAVLILAVAGVRMLFGNRLSKGLLSFFWMLAALRLLCPFYIPIQVAPRQQISEETLSLLAAETRPAEPNVFLQLLPFLWLAGLICSLAFFIGTHLRCCKKYRASVPVKDPAVLHWKACHPLRRGYQIRISDEISTALTYGVFHPIILLPKSLVGLKNPALSCVLTHEYIHIRRWDAFKKWMFVFIASIYWFHPLVWLFYDLANRDMEISCDDKVLRLLGGTQQKNYALTLLALEEKKKLSLLCNGFSKNFVEERIVSIMKRKKASLICTIVTLGLVAAATTMTAFAVASETAPNPADSPAAMQENPSSQENAKTLINFDLDQPLQIKFDDDGKQYAQIEGIDGEYKLYYANSSADFPSGYYR